MNHARTESPSYEIAAPAMLARPAENALDTMALLRSLRRRWLPCLLLGLPLAAAAGIAAWMFLPAPYIATAEIYFKSFDDNLVFETSEAKASIRTRKETHQRLVTSRQVLTAALRSIDVPRTRTLADVGDEVGWLAENVVVKRAGEEFFTISLAGEHPQELEKIVNAVADAYMSEVVHDEVDRRRADNARLQQVSDSVKEELQLKRNELRELAKKSNSSSREQADQSREHQLELRIEVRKQLNQVEMELLHHRVRDQVQGGEQEQEQIPDSVLDNLLAREPDYQAAEKRVEQFRRFLDRNTQLPSNHPTRAKAARDLADAETKLASLRETLKPRILEQIEQQQKAEKDLTGQRLKDHIATLERTKAELEKELEGIQVSVDETGIYSIELDEITKELGRLEALSDQLTAEIERRELELKNASDRLVAQINERAIPPTSRSMKKKLVGTLGASGGTLGLIFFAIAFLDYRVGRITTQKEISDKLSMRLIATIPALPRSVMNSGASGRHRKKTVFWTSALKESIDAARTMLLAHAARDGMKAILVSSSIPAEGKTTLSLHLATSLARAGRRVVLVDADLRRPSLSHIYGLEGAGLCEVIRGEAALTEALNPGNIDGLTILAAGALDETVLEEIADDGLDSIFRSLREQFDFVIVDSPPVLPLCDALLIARHVDSVVFALRRDVSRRAMVVAALDRFRSMGVPVLGAVAIGLHDDPAGYSEIHLYRDQYDYGRTTVGV